jgi:hypothetical protein
MTFQQLMDYLLGGLPHASVYLDDILIASSSAVEHRCLCQVFSLLKQSGLIINADASPDMIPLSSSGTSPLSSRV